MAHLFAPSTPVVLITGANRGIGLGLVRVYLERGWSVIATCRTPAKAGELEGLAGCGRLRIAELDIASGESVTALKKALADQPIDVLINNAGVFDEDRSLGDIDYGEWRTVLEINVLGPVRVTEALMPNLQIGGGRKIAVISSALGAISGTTGGRYVYRSSKAAVNMVFRSMAKDLQKVGITVAVLSPGLVDTDLTRALDKPKISVKTSAQGLVEVISNLTPDQSGAFLRFDGSVLNW